MTAVWSRIVATDAMGERLLGPANTAGTTGAVRRQIEALTTRAGFVHWWDPELALAWIDRAVALTSTETEARLDAAPYAEQVAGTLDAWEALGRAYDALGLPWVIDPAAREAYTSKTIGLDSRLWCDNREWGGRAAMLSPGPYIGTEDGGVPCVRLLARIGLRPSDNGVVNVVHQNEDNGDEWNAGWNRPGRGLDWDSFRWRYECNTRTGLGDCERWISWFLPPLHWYFTMAQTIARSLRARGPLRVVAEALRLAFILNVKTASTAGPGGTSVLSQAVGVNAATALVGLAATQVAEAHMPSQELDDVARGMEEVGRDVAEVPVIGTPLKYLLGGFARLARFFNTIIPPAVARDFDEWGRDRPVYELTVRTGGEGLNDPPTHEVPDPPGWTRPAEASTGGPGGGGGGSAPPADGDGSAVVPGLVGLLAVGLGALAVKRARRR